MYFFQKNGLANHAAAGAFGFLLSAAPALILAVFFFMTAFRSSPQMIHELLENIPFIEIAFDETWLANVFLSFTGFGLSAVISVLGIFWAGRIIAASLHRGLKVVFTGDKKRRAIVDNLLVFLLEMFVLIFALVMILFSGLSVRLFEVFDYHLPVFLLSLVTTFRLLIFHLAALLVISFCMIRIAPANAPSVRSAFFGSLCTATLFLILSSAFEIIVSQTRYHFIYGALGNLIFVLLNVYFFFVFFFFGAQLAFVIDNFDALLFVQFRKMREKKKNLRPSRNGASRSGTSRSGLRRKLFHSVEGNLKKFKRSYAKGEKIFSKGCEKKEIFYLLEGEVEVLIPMADNSPDVSISSLTSSFFGEMGYLLSENRNATVKAKTDVSVLVLPEKLFNDIIKHDPAIDRIIIEQLSRRLKHSNEKMSELVSKDLPRQS